MRVKSITYAMLRVQRQFENDRVEATVELEAGDTIAEAIAEAKRVCTLALRTDPAIAAPGGRTRVTADDPRAAPRNDRPIELYPEPRYDDDDRVPEDGRM